MKKFYLKTLGCKVNQCDSQKIREDLLSLGWSETDGFSDADISIVNTCCVTNQADRKSRNAIRSVVRKNPNAKVFVTGCYATYEKAAIEKIEGVTDVFENNKKEEIPLLLSGRDSPLEDNFGPVSFGGRTRAFLKIQDGCNNHCSYCIVPLVRGKSRSKALEAILKEAEFLVESGHKEIVLTGVCLGSYGRDLKKSMDIVDVVTAIEKIDGCQRIRLSSVEAVDVTERLIEKMSVSKKLCPHLHIPFQSGDDEVLAAMNKRVRVKNYFELVENAKQRIKGLAITCDMIIGFPTETRENFNNSMDFLKVISPLRTHLFPFSSRRGSLAGKLKKVYDSVELQHRVFEAKRLVERLALDFVKKNLGKKTEVLFEAREDGLWRGYSGNYIDVAAYSDEDLANTISTVKLVDFKGFSALGELDK